MKRLNDIFKVFLLLSLTSFFVNCTIEDIDDVKSALPYLVIETDSVSFDNVNTYIEIPIKTNRELTIETSYIDSSGVDPWLEASLSANSDTLRISVAEYNQNIRRRAILTLSSRNDLVDHKITVSQKGSFIPDWKPIDGVYNLSQNGTANCYIVPKSGEYAFYALTKGNSTLPVGDVSTVEVLWETRNTIDKVSVGQIISDVKFDNGYIYFEASGLRGNALIAVKDVTDTIIWSWHIWVTNYDPDENNCTYLSGAVMMDRNLGALNCGADPESFGFLYQWGRKDPLLGSADGSTTFATTAPVVKKQQVTVSNPVEYSFANPINLVDNLFNDSSAWGRTKTMYDPCPPGWRVPDGGYDGVWKGMIYGSPGITGGYHFGAWSIHPPYSTPETIYPAPGYTDGDCGLKLLFPGSALYCWSCDHISTNRAYGMHLFDRIERELNAAKEAEFSVRCMKDDGNSIPPAPEPAPVETTYTVVGDIEGYSWDYSSPVGLMTKEDKFYVAKNIPFKSIQFKIVKTGGWDVVYGVKEGKAYGLNTEIPVSINHSYNICVQAPEERKYDVYFDLDNEKVWFMEPGKRPGDEITSEKPGGTEGLPDEGYEWE